MLTYMPRLPMRRTAQKQSSRFTPPTMNPQSNMRRQRNNMTNAYMNNTPAQQPRYNSSTPPMQAQRTHANNAMQSVPSRSQITAERNRMMSHQESISTQRSGMRSQAPQTTFTIEEAAERYHQELERRNARGHNRDDRRRREITEVLEDRFDDAIEDRLEKVLNEKFDEALEEALEEYCDVCDAHYERESDNRYGSVDAEFAAIAASIKFTPPSNEEMEYLRGGNKY